MSYKFDPENPFKSERTRVKKAAQPENAKGLSVEPFFSTPGVHPFEQLEWETRTAKISSDTGEAVFEQDDFTMVRVENTFELLSYARVSSRRVLTALEHLYDARNEASDALTDYANATLNFYRDTEVLEVRPDGMWELRPGTVPVAQGRRSANE